MPSLEPSAVYQNDSPGFLFITPDQRTLSHGFLAAAERGALVLACVDDETWTSLKNAKSARIDFDNAKIDLEFA